MSLYRTTSYTCTGTLYSLKTIEKNPLTIQCVLLTRGRVHNVGGDNGLAVTVTLILSSTASNTHYIQ